MKNPLCTIGIHDLPKPGGEIIDNYSLNPKSVPQFVMGGVCKRCKQAFKWNGYGYERYTIFNETYKTK